MTRTGIDTTGGRGLNSRHRTVSLALAVPGVFVCLGAVAAFVLRMSQNGLPDDVGTSVRASYLAVGDAFSRGFAAGFFLCFFLVIVAFAIGTWVEHRRARCASATKALEAPSRGR